MGRLSPGVRVLAFSFVACCQRLSSVRLRTPLLMGGVVGCGLGLVLLARVLRTSACTCVGKRGRELQGKGGAAVWLVGRAGNAWTEYTCEESTCWDRVCGESCGASALTGRTIVARTRVEVAATRAVRATRVRSLLGGRDGVASAGWAGRTWRLCHS